MEQERMKINVEILHTGDGRVFVNHWDYGRGDDTTCELIDGELHLNVYEKGFLKITFSDFIEIVTRKLNRK